MNANYFFKLKFYLGLSNAIKVYWQKFFKSNKISINFIKYPFTLRYNDPADWQIFNEVILKRSYMGFYNDKSLKLNILDLGGNIGLAAISFLSEFPNCTVISIEPEEANFNILLQNVAAYKERSIAIKAAVSSASRELYVYDSFTGSHGFRTSEIPIEEAMSVVRGVTINEIIEENKWDRIDILKIDIEGAEFELFSKNTEWLNKVKLLIIETHDKFGLAATKRVFKTLDSFEYTVKVINNNLVIKFI